MLWGGALYLIAGLIGLAGTYLPDLSLAHGAIDLTEKSIGIAAHAMGSPQPDALARRAAAVLAGGIAPLALAPLGLLLLLLGLLPGEATAEDEESEDEEFGGAMPIDKRFAKKAKREASRLAKKGQHEQAAELYLENDFLDDAAKCFVKAERFDRAAEIRHDQNRFEESAELYLRAERFEAAAGIFAQQQEHARAAECYERIGSTSLAAEMYEKAEDFQKAADCYDKAGFPLPAAQAYVRCRQWERAACCLETVFIEESSGMAARDPQKRAELKDMVQRAGTLFERTGLDERAEAILERGECYVEAGEVALRHERFGKAAELFQTANEPRRAAEALKLMGENQEAARILGEYHRERNESKEAAQCFEEAGEIAAAADIYRQIEDHAKAGECYERATEGAQAAEMFCLAGDRERAAENFERAGKFAEAAECWALVGNTARETELLARAGRYLTAGQVHHREGRDDDAITILQRVETESDESSEASALLGDIFHARGMFSLAIKKLRHATADSELTRENIPVYYRLATVYEANDEPSEAADIYEKILAFDYHYSDVAKRLTRAREQLKHSPQATSKSEPVHSPTLSAASEPKARYKIVGELGRGGMGIVYKAEDTVLDRIVAYKVLPDSLRENELALKNFLREAKSAARLNHPNIVTVYDAGEQDGEFYIAMEYVDGTTIKEILRLKGAISPGAIVHVLRQLCEGLAFAHTNKIIHRDIKTANTMWTRDKKAKIMDFGLAKAVEEVRNHTTVVSGTPYYMSPEQTLGRNIDHRTDIYSLGVTIFEMATNTLPFHEGNIPYHHVHTPPPDIRGINADLPEFLACIVERCLKKDPAERFQSTGEILEELRNSLNRDPTTPTD